METVVYESYFNIYTEKPVTSTWQYQDESGQWTSYDEDTNSKIEKAFSRNHSGMCIIEINKTV
jgi:hypothetical protein